MPPQRQKVPVTFRGQTKTCLSLRGLNVADCTGPGNRNEASNSP